MNRKPLARMFNTTVEILSVTRGTDASRARTRSYSPRPGGPFPARVREVGGQELADLVKSGSEINAYLYLPSETPIAASDQVIWRGKTYHVCEPPIDQHGLGHHVRAGLKTVIPQA